MAGRLESTALRASSWRKRTWAPSISSSRWRSGSSAAPGHPGITSSSTDALTRFGTAETSSTSLRDGSSRRDTRASTALATEGGSSAASREASSSVT